MIRCRQAAIEKTLKLRADILRLVRGFFISRGYLEVETPIRIPAPAPEAHIEAEPSGPWFLHTSPELCMKRLLSAGYSHIFQLCKCFRKGERGEKHLPEITLLEWYRASATYEDLMDECEDLIGFLARQTGAGDCLVYQGITIDLTSPWPRLAVSEAFDRYASLSMVEALACGKFDEAMGLEIEPELNFGRPVFLYDYPASKGALARRKHRDGTLAERFELYIAGLELCNAFSELTDAAEQRARFEAEIADRCRLGRPITPMPVLFLEALDHMPPAAGCAFGIDRLVMLFADAARIDTVVAFTPEEL